ncbi:hypothetical protein [Streptomyces sp. CBMA152]|uniref:hypothetical protein n=1 Tax=Streptomyces sp. CBMA152 TaxID=1896312 RepID=UPI0016617DB0|nr:hypothetical protein [Streptomyces sp. CBMA152]
MTDGPGAQATRGGGAPNGRTPVAKARTTGRSLYGAAQANALPLPQRSRALLPERSLGVKTVASAGFSATSPAPTAAVARPVVAARWSSDAVPTVQTAPSRRQPSLPADPPRASGPSRHRDGPERQSKGRTRRGVPLEGQTALPAARTASPEPQATPSKVRAPLPNVQTSSPEPQATPQNVQATLPTVQSAVAARGPARSAADSARSSGPDTAPRARAPHRTPVVRPAPPVSPSATAPVQRLPISMAPPTTVPPPPDAAAPSPRAGTQPPLKAATRTTAASAPIQRAPEDSKPTDAPTPRSRIPVPVKKTSSSAEQSTVPPQHGDGIDVEDLARRLIDPVARLLRADLRRGRERAGRLHDGRR